MKNKWIILLVWFCHTSIFVHAQSPEWNIDFEIWDLDDTTPNLWFDTTIVENRIGLFPPNWHYRPDAIQEGRGLGRTTDATSGEYAVALSGFYSYPVMRIISGDNAETPGWGIDIKPNKLIGDYKAILLGNDCDSLKAYVDVFLTQNNSVNGVRDTIGYGNVVLNETTNAYSQFEVNINYSNNNTIPDSVIIVLAKERFGNDTPPDCLECSHVFFDNLRFTTPSTAIDEDDQKFDFIISPNPATKQLYIASNHENSRVDVTLISSNGQIKKIYSNIENSFFIDVSDFRKGIYFLKIEDKKTRHFEYKKVIIQ